MAERTIIIWENMDGVADVESVEMRMARIGHKEMNFRSFVAVA